MGVVLTFRKLVCVPVVLMVLAPPLLACTLPGVEMSDEEMACCRDMANQCGDSAMPASHSCCKKSSLAQASAFQIKQRDPASQEMGGQLPLAAHVPSQHALVEAVAKSSFDCPESPPGHTSVLRI